MKLKTTVVLTACLAAASLAALCACNTNQPGTQTPEDDYGTLSIESVKVYTDVNKSYTFAEIEPVFSKPDMAEELTYTYDTADIKIENNIVIPLKRADKQVNVRASSEHFSTVFQVEIERVLYTGTNASQLYDTSKYPVSQRAETCKAVTQDTTLFIGDSFMDDYFIGDYMSIYGADKEVLNAGMNSSTSYHWEACFKTVIGATAPKNIVMHIGTNNFYDEHDLVDTTEESLTRLFMFMHSQYPQTNIYWFNITQRTNTGYASQVTQTNEFMAEWCGKYDWITCVDTCSRVGSSLLRDDGVHPTDAGYKVFTDALAEAGCQIVSKN